MAKSTATVKKWGGSLAIVIDAALAHEKGLRPGTKVSYDLEPADVTLGEIRGLLKDVFKDYDWSRLDEDLAEMDRGWND